jgi:hypothetical protein
LTEEGKEPRGCYHGGGETGRKTTTCTIDESRRGREWRRKDCSKPQLLRMEKKQGFGSPKTNVKGKREGLEPPLKTGFIDLVRG